MKITIDKAVLDQALDALEMAKEQLHGPILVDKCHVASRRLREALAHPAAQPAACQHQWFGTGAMDQSEARCILCGEWKLKAQPAAQCTNSDTWNCKYCRKTESCEALKDPRNFASAAQPAAQPTEADADAAINETNAVLAGRYFDLLKVVEAYEKNGVTCQTFRHFVDAPCAECNSTPSQAHPTEPAGEPVAHFGSAYVNENGVHITTVLGPVAIPQGAALYTRPAVPLTDEQIAEITVDFYGSAIHEDDYGFARAIEAAHKIGGAE